MGFGIEAAVHCTIDEYSQPYAETDHPGNNLWFHVFHPAHNGVKTDRIYLDIQHLNYTLREAEWVSHFRGIRG